MSVDSRMELYETQAELIETKEELVETKEELEKIRKEYDALKSQLAANNLIKTVNDFQTKFSRSLETIQENFNTLSVRVSNNEDTSSEIRKNNDTQARTVFNNLAIVQKDVTTLSKNFNALSGKCNTMSENVASSSARVLNNDQILYEISETLRQINENLNKQNESIRILKTNVETETILLVGGKDGKDQNSLLILEDYGQNWKELNIKLPYEVQSHGAQFLNNNLYIFGGYNRTDKCLNWTYKLSKSLQWEKVADMNKKRDCISNSSVILNNQIWVCGGWNPDDKSLKSTELYDPVTNKWKYMKKMNECRKNAAAAVVNGKIFCSGGFNRGSLNSVECYDPSSDGWILICNMPKNIFSHGAVEMDGNLVAMGGYSGGYLKNVWTLGTTNKNTVWTEKSSMSIPRTDFSIAKTDGRVFICGGSSHGKAIDSVEIFDGEVWRDGPKMSTPRINAPAVVIPMKFARSLN